MSKLTAEIVKQSLAHVIDERSGENVADAGVVSGIVIRDGERGAKVGFVITIDPTRREAGERLREACERAVSMLAGVESVTAVLTAQNSEPIPAKPETGYTQPRERAVWNLTPVEGVKQVVAIASGKGGVGKSTTAVNLAFALVRMGKRVGLLDADIYGPSLPRMLGLMAHTQQPPAIEQGKMVPPMAQGIPCMSMAFVTGEQAAILRGPMISKTLHQLLRFTRWADAGAPLDVLLVDMPPGTGDIHLSMVQQVPLAGAVIVTTPQEVAVMDARKALEMFRKTNVAVLGVVENMSYFTDSAGQRVALFGQGGGAALAKAADVAFLGDIAIDAQIGAAADAGTPYAGAAAGSYDLIAQRLFSALV